MSSWYSRSWLLGRLWPFISAEVHLSQTGLGFVTGRRSLAGRGLDSGPGQKQAASVSPSQPPRAIETPHPLFYLVEALAKVLFARLGSVGR